MSSDPQEPHDVSMPCFVPTSPGPYAWDTVPCEVGRTLHELVRSSSSKAPIVYHICSRVGGAADRMHSLPVLAYLALILDRPLKVSPDALYADPGTTKPAWVHGRWGHGPCAHAAYGHGSLNASLASSGLPEALWPSGQPVSSDTPIYLSSHYGLGANAALALQDLVGTLHSTRLAHEAEVVLKNAGYQHARRFGAALLHAAWGVQQGSLTHVSAVQTAAHAVQAWQDVAVGDTFTALHMRAGRAPIKVRTADGEGSAEVPALLYGDGMGGHMAQAWLDSLRNLTSPTQPNPPTNCSAPFVLVTNSMRFSAEVAGILQHTAPVATCCQSPAHVGAQMGNDFMQMSAEMQVLVDLIILGKAKHAVLTQ